jgi:hypothetical protein
MPALEQKKLNQDQALASRKIRLCTFETEWPTPAANCIGDFRCILYIGINNKLH